MDTSCLDFRFAMISPSGEARDDPEAERIRIENPPLKESFPAHRQIANR
jgi:hypothetical protein